MRRNFESGFGTDEEPESMSDEQREFRQELKDFADGLNLPGEEDLIKRVIAKIESSDNTEAAREELRELENQLAATLGEEEERIEVLREYVGDSEEDLEEDDEDEDGGWDDDDDEE